MALKSKHNDIGLDTEAPKALCESEKCPWHGSLKVRGRMFRGRIVSSRPAETAVVEWNFYHFIPKYQRSMRKKTRISAHNPKCIGAKVNDTVRIAECRPLSKTKRFVVIEKL